MVKFHASIAQSAILIFCILGLEPHINIAQDVGQKWIIHKFMKDARFNMIDEKKLKEAIRENMIPERFGRRCDPLDVIYGILQVIDEQPKVGEWIPCSDKLPDEEGIYLVTFKQGKSVRLVGYGCSQRTVLWEPIGYGWHDLRTADYYASDSITAWQPLPEPWKGVEL